jgi:diguanylate cyclase (GGDEF)-like protein/PAS domain S-box-containing protein
MISASDNQAFRLMFEQHALAMLIIEPLTGEILDANPAAVNFYAYPESKLCGMPIDDLNPLVTEQLVTGRKAFSEERNHYVCSHTLASGEERTVEIHLSPIALQEKQVLFAIIHDITGRKQAEPELRRVHAALEIAHRELQESFARVQDLARVDELTGINNRRSLVEFMEREFNVAMRYGPPLTIVMFDIDDFKQINDTFGHSVGDQVLKRLTQVVRAKLRAADAIGRYGGDEFVIVCPHTRAQEALPLAERIHASIASVSIETDNGPLTIGISIGIAQAIHNGVPCSGETDTLEHLLRRADKALYAAKQTGKNRTVTFDSK